MQREALSATLQESLLVILCFDERYAPLIRQNAPPRLFDPELRPIIQEIYSYIDRYGGTPKAHTDELFERVAERSDEDEEIWELLEAVRDIKDEVNPEWATKRLDAFVRTQEMKQTIWDVADQLHGEVDDEVADEISEKLNRATQRRVASMDIGRRLSDPSATSFLDRREGVILPLGIEWLDRHDIGPTKGELLLLSAVYGAGKSFFLNFCGKKALMQRWKTLHITLEMEAENVERRYHQNLMGIAQFNEPSGRYDLEVDEWGRVENLDWVRHTPEHHMEDPKISKVLNEKREKMGKWLDNIWIKKFPPRWLTTAKMESFLDLLEHQEGFVPDMIIVDYIDIMHWTSETKRHDITGHAQGLRKIASERDCATVTVGQLNREAMKTKKKSGAHISEDIGKGREADIHLIYDQTEQEAKMGLARLSIDKARNAPGQKQILLSQDYNYGQFCLKSAVFDSSAKRIVESLRPGATGDEDDEPDDGFFE